MPRLESYQRSRLFVRACARMAQRSAWWLTVAIVLAFCAATLVFVEPVSADHPQLTLQFEPNATLGEGVLVQVSFDEPSNPVAGQAITLLLNNRAVATAQTNSSGRVAFVLAPEQLREAGDYTVRAFYEGSPSHHSAQSAQLLTVHPAQLTVQTVPPLAGMRFALGDKLFVSDHSGLATVAVSQAGTQNLSVLLPAPQRNAMAKLSVLFGLWQDGVQETIRPINVPSTTHITAGFEITRRVALTFKTPDGDLVNPLRVDSVTIADSFGREQSHTNLHENPYIWLPATKLEQGSDGLNSDSLRYAVTSVIVDGSNVLQGSEQPFSPEATPNVTVRSVLHTVRISARDNLLKRPLGQTVVLEYPDGTITRHALSANGSAEISGLARGRYYATITESEGLASRASFFVSQSQTLHIPILSYLDLTFIMSGVFILLVGWVGLSRPLWLQPFSWRILGATRSVALGHLMRTNRLVWTATITMLCIGTLAGMYLVGSTLGAHQINQYRTQFETAWTAQTPLPTRNEAAIDVAPIDVTIVSGAQPQEPTPTPTAIVIADHLNEQLSPNANGEAATNVERTVQSQARQRSGLNERATPTPAPRIHVVRSGETLITLARHYYNDPTAWERIWHANREKLGDSAEPMPWDLLIIP